MISYVFKPARWLNGRRHVREHYSGELKLDTWAKPRVFALHTTDRRIAEMKLIEIAKDFEKEALGLMPARSIRDALNTPLAKHLDSFAADLKAKGATEGDRSKLARPQRRRGERLTASFVVQRPQMRQCRPQSFTGGRPRKGSGK